ncbi:MAG: hypothetical protein HGA51_00590 [Demequinaceae bacterium]|nr:hypothetical protein [Demequinaceae bacterium]
MSRAAATATATAIIASSGALAGCAALPDPWRDAGRIAWFHIGSTYGASRACLDGAVQGAAGTDEEIAARVMTCFDTSVVGETASQRIAGAQLTGNRTWLLDSTLTGTGLRVDAASVGHGNAVVGGVAADASLMACWTAQLGPDRVWLVEGRACEPYLLNSVEGVAEGVSLKKVVRHVGDSIPGA